MQKGIVASPGIEIGRAYIFEHEDTVVSQKNIQAKDVETEINRLRNALERSKEQIIDIKQRSEEELGKEKAEIFEAHLMMLEDPVFIEEIKNKIIEEKITSENAASQVMENYVSMFSAMEDEYLKERAEDVKDVGTRIIKNILGISTKTLSELSKEVIIISKDLTPSDTAQMDKQKVLAFATDMGGPTSHTAIMARSLEIPAVVGLVDVTSKVKDGDCVIIDGNKGLLYIKPDKNTLNEYKRKRQDYIHYKQELKKLKKLPAKTKDKRRQVVLSANIGTPADVEGALENGAEGIGLYRTEFLYMDRDNLPTEEEQFQAYKEVAEKMLPHSVIIRTLDVGGDKELPYLKMPKELNPFLGWRAIRMCLDTPEILKTQLKAILRASYYGKLKIMYPMISGITEIRKANAVLEKAKTELRAKNISFDKTMEVGIMIEVPAAALITDILAKEVDFFSIGSNDLIQYTIAVDRTNEYISHLYEPLHPAVLRLIKNVIDASHNAGIWTGMCGEMARDKYSIPILLGMGLDEFSMGATSILPAKNIIREMNLDEAKTIAKKALKINNPHEIRAMIKGILDRL